MTSAENGKVGWALQQDYADAAAAVLSGEGHENTVYELSGKLLTQEEIASALGEVLGKEVPVQHVDDAAYRDIMKMRVCRISDSDGCRYPKGIREGTLEVESDDLKSARPSAHAN
ncbi:hypothetical protein PO124_11990 [Bacillus licheniformis]|nr:hypothetical protein [Bacillus licheniformis]